MNMGSGIDFNKSSLLSLKAELARKHEEVSKAKAQAQGNYIRPLAKPSKSSIFSRTNSGLEKREERDTVEISPEEEVLLHKAKSSLEAKAKIYDSLSEQHCSEKSSEYLVNFEQKIHESRRLQQTSISEEKRKEAEEERNEAYCPDSDEYDTPSDPEDDWVDYTDCLGRTRRCLRRDLENFKALDSRLKESLEPKVSIPPQNQSAPASAHVGPSLESDDMRREQQRLKWEEQEMKLRDKTDVHYQDLLFDEARTHGVGYFPFSQDESTRRTQQEDLKKQRKETEQLQTVTQTQREKRKQQLRARLRAAHNRKRAREGLPPLAEDEDLPGEKKEDPEPEPELEPAPVVQRATGPKPRASPAVRPWDIGKQGVPSKPVLTQDEWNEKKRAERKKQFAPPSFYSDTESVEDPTSHDLKRKQRSDLPEGYLEDLANIPPAPESEVSHPIKLFFTSKKPKRTVENAISSQNSASRIGAEIPPPPTFEYFGPTDKSTKIHSGRTPTNEELSSSIAAGLQFLRKQVESKGKGGNRDDIADYIG